MLRRWLALVAVGLIVFVGAAMAVSALTSHPRVRRITQPGPLVVVAMPSLSWADVSPTRTPALWALAKRGAVAAQTTRDLSAHSCSNQSWLTLSAGMPTTLGRSVGQTPQGHEPGPCPKPSLPQPGPDGSAAFPRWDHWRHLTRTSGSPEDIGRLGTSLAAAGQCITAAGEYAALGASNRAGGIAHYSASTDNVDLVTCPVTFIGLRGPDDAYLARLVPRLPAEATLVVTGMADDTGPETLHTVVMTGPGVSHGLLTSLSTRQPGFLQTTDLSALVLARLGADAPNLPEGRSPVVRPVTSPTEPMVQVTDLTRALNVEYPFVRRFFALFLGGAGSAMAIGLLWWWLGRRGQAARHEPWRPPRLLRWWFAVVGAMCASMPVATFLVGILPWWRSAHPQVALSLAVVGVSAVLTLLALLGPWRRWVGGPMTFLMVATLFVITQDVVHGSRLQFISLMGLQPVYGGRYFGQGNVGYAVYSTTALLLAAVLAGRVIDAGHRRVAAMTVILIGVAAVVVDGYPAWGADAGGPVAMIPAFAYLTLSAAGLSFTWRRLVVVAGSTVGIVGGFALVDYLGPTKYRTHLGDFVANLRDTGQLTGLVRIWTDNWALLTSTWLDMTVALLLLVLMVALVLPHTIGRPLRPLLAGVTLLGPGLAAVAVCLLLGFFSNDSGTVIPPTGLLVLIPLLILLAACLRRPAAADPSAPPLAAPDESLSRVRHIITPRAGRVRDRPTASTAPR